MLKKNRRPQKTALKILINSLIGIGIVLILNSSAMAQTNGSKSSDPNAVIVLIVSGLLGIVGGIVAAYFTSTQNIKELKEEFKLHEKEQKREEIAKLRRDYLNPLRLSAEELKERLINLQDKQINHMDYKQFYTALMDDNICSAFLRMSDYYVDFKDKDFKSIISSLEALIAKFGQDSDLYQELIEA